MTRASIDTGGGGVPGRQSRGRGKRPASLRKKGEWRTAWKGGARANWGGLASEARVSTVFFQKWGEDGKQKKTRLVKRGFDSQGARDGGKTYETFKRMSGRGRGRNERVAKFIRRNGGVKTALTTINEPDGVGVHCDGKVYVGRVR